MESLRVCVAPYWYRLHFLTTYIKKILKPKKFFICMFSETSSQTFIKRLRKFMLLKALYGTLIFSTSIFPLFKHPVYLRYHNAASKFHTNHTSKTEVWKAQWRYLLTRHTIMLSLRIKLDSPSLKKVYFQIRSFKKIQNLTKKVWTQNVALIKTKLLTYFEPISTSTPHENMRKRPVFRCF